MLTVATYLWFDPDWPHNDKFTYKAEDVRLLQRMVKRNLSIPHRFVCITDQPQLFDGDEEVVAVPLDKSTHVPGRCFVRLFTFSPQAADLLGEKVLQLDLDCIVTGDLTPLVDRDEDIVLWKNPTRKPWRNPESHIGRSLYNSSIVYHRCGTMPEIYSEFLPSAYTPERIKDDQWWLSHVFGHNAPCWDDQDGVYRIARADTPGSGINGALPDNARIVMFPGDRGKPWLPEILERHPWITEYRR